MGFLLAFLLLWVCWFGGFFNTEFSRMFQSSKAKTRRKLFSYLTFILDYCQTASAQQGRLQFPFLCLHSTSVPVLAKENSCTAQQPYVSVLTHRRWLLSFLTAEDKRFLYFLNILTSKDKVYILRRVLERGKHTLPCHLRHQNLCFICANCEIWMASG